MAYFATGAISSLLPTERPYDLLRFYLRYYKDEFHWVFDVQEKLPQGWIIVLKFK